MARDDSHYTFNPLSNEDKQLLLTHGYRPGELHEEEAQEILRDLRSQVGDDEDSDHPSNSVPADEWDDTF